MNENLSKINYQIYDNTWKTWLIRKIKHIYLYIKAYSPSVFFILISITGTNVGNRIIKRYIPSDIKIDK
jgi:hypothetical protein